MGGRIGSRMERALKKEEIGIAAMNNQTVRHEDDSPGIDDEDTFDQVDGLFRHVSWNLIFLVWVGDTC